MFFLHFCPLITSRLNLILLFHQLLITRGTRRKLQIPFKRICEGFDSCVDIYGNISSRLNTQSTVFGIYLYPFWNKNCHLNQIPPHFLEFLGRHTTFPRFIGYPIGFLLRQFIEKIIGRKYSFPPQVLR